jgi:hypothetical protein
MKKQVRRAAATNLVDSTPLGSIGDRVKHDRTLLWSQGLFGLNFLIKLNQLLGDRLAEQGNQSLAVILGDGIDLRLVVRLEIGSRGLAVDRRL